MVGQMVDWRVDQKDATMASTAVAWLVDWMAAMRVFERVALMAYE